MRALRLAAAFLAIVASPQLAPPAGAASSSAFTVSCGTANAGSDVPCTVTRTSGGKGLYVLFATSDVTAHAGTDYMTVRQLLYFKASAITQTVAVHTAVNPNATGTVTFTASIAVGSVPSSTTGSIVEPATAPPPANSWVSAPLQDGGFARVKANDADWDMTGPGNGRVLVPGEIVAVYFNGWGNDTDGATSFAIYALNDGTTGRAKAADLEGVAPVGTPPGLPADWWVPGLVTANKTCGSATHAGQPGVVQGGVYRAAMLVGSHMKLATGVTGDASNIWIVFATGAQQYTTPQVVVMGDCLTGQ